MRQSSPAKESEGFSLEVVEGPDLGVVFHVATSRLTPVLLGRSVACEFRLTDARVSARHLLLQVVEHGLEIRDLKSPTGTHVNGLRAREATLRGGERLRVGTSTLHVEAKPTAPGTIEERFGPIVGASFAMRRLYPVLRKLCGSDLPVLLEGEAGVGKGLVARVLHERSGRSAGPFVVHDAGARDDLRAAVASARGGTLLLEKLGNLDPSAQATLHATLRSSEEGEVRVIGTMDRDLALDVESGRLREDLYFQLAAARVRLPPLRERRGDVRLLAAHLWQRVGGDSAGPPDDLLRRLDAYPWPGNVRELANGIAHCVTFGELADLGSLWRPARMRARKEPAPQGSADLVGTIVSEELPFHVARNRVVRHFERKYIETMIARHGGNVAKAARAAGVARRYFYAIRDRNR
jgi:DNA-binding NtrC family response regulator